MDAIITVDGEALARLIEWVKAADDCNAYRLRIAVDAGELKVKINEGVWSPPLALAHAGA